MSIGNLFLKSYVLYMFSVISLVFLEILFLITAVSSRILFLIVTVRMACNGIPLIDPIRKYLVELRLRVGQIM